MYVLFIITIHVFSSLLDSIDLILVLVLYRFLTFTLLENARTEQQTPRRFMTIGINALRSPLPVCFSFNIPFAIRGGVR